MPEEKDVTADPGANEQRPPVKKTLPPLTSSRPAGGAARSLPPIASARPAGQPAARAAATPTPASQQLPDTSAPTAARPPAPPPVAPVKPTPTSEPQSASTASAPKPPAEIRKPKQDKPPENDNGIWRMSRKNFLNVASWFSFIGFLATATLGAIRLMVPRVLYEAPSAFKAGFPDDFIIGEVNEKYKDEYRVWIVRNEEGFYALSAICTHLGCTPRWLDTENKFKCPCHGSGYHRDGVNFEGPTPRPLERLKITLADDGQLLIDRNIKFLYEKQEWTKSEAFLKYS